MAEVIQGHDDQSRYQRQLPDKVMHPDPVTLETAERPNDIKKQDWAFVARLRAAYDRWWQEVLPCLENEEAVGPKINPFKERFWKQFGGGPAGP